MSYYEDKHDNKVILLGYYGGDERVCLSAWQSTNVELNVELSENVSSRIVELFEATVVNKKKSPEELLKLLAKEGHHTPFEKAVLDFQITGDVASHIHCLKHRIASINSECLTGDAAIKFVNINNVSSNKFCYTLKELHNKWNSGRSYQNTEKDKEYSRSRIRNMKLRVLNEKTGIFEHSHIKDIWYKGVQDVYLITLENGEKIKCTDNHKIYTNDGYKTISEGLKINDLVGCNGVKINIKEKPYTFEEFYKDSENYTRIEFAKKVSSSDFQSLSKIWDSNKRIGEKLKVHYSNIVSIIYVGKEETYDIEVEGENNNFIANNIVVHNSARYKELDDKWYLPKDWECKSVKATDFNNGTHCNNSIQGMLEMWEREGYDWYSLLDSHIAKGHQYYHEAIKQLTPILGRKRAKESARYFLSYAKQLDYDMQLNFRSFINFQKLRNSDHAQREIHWIAEEMLRLVKEIPNNPFRYCLEAFEL